jgi:hypothetical protein
MSDQPILFCPQWNHVCKSLRGLAQHITHRPACRHKSLPILEGICIQKPTVHQSFVQLDAPYANKAIEPMWHQNDDHDTVAALHPFLMQLTSMLSYKRCNLFPINETSWIITSLACSQTTAWWTPVRCSTQKTDRTLCLTQMNHLHLKTMR